MMLAYLIALLALTIFSFGFVDANFPIRLFPEVFQFVHANRPSVTALYLILLILLFSFYFWILRQVQKKKAGEKTIWKLVGATCLILFFSFPAFSYDLFNYIATAKVTFQYQENPYLITPLEIANEPMLTFLHAANKVALYGPTWIALTFIPYLIGGSQLLLGIWATKAMVAVFYLGLSWFIWRLSGKNIRSVVFFALNPLVVTETLVSGHNDVVMMFLALGAFWAAKQKRFWLGLLLLTLSVFVKGATIVLLPIYLGLWWKMMQDSEVKWQKVWQWAALFLLVTFLLAPLREELYSWYFIWPLTFIALLPRDHRLQFLAYGFSLGLPLRFAPFIYFGDWGGVVPAVKKIVSLVPPTLTTLYYVVKKKV